MIISLDGQWQLGADPDNVGRDQAWFKAPRSDAVPARVPYPIQERFPGYHGVAWYWRMFSAPPNLQDGRCAMLRFWAVDYAAEVWLNGVPVGGHEGGETPFTLDVTDAIRPDANVLAVRVLNPANEPIDGIVLAQTPHRNKSIPHRVGGSYNYGGILESVELLLIPAISIEDLFVQSDSKTGTIAIEASLRNATAETQRAQLTFAAEPSAGGETVATTMMMREVSPGEAVIRTQLQIQQPRLWDLHDPYLYRVSAQLHTQTGESDARLVRCGFRDFRVVDGYFRLNGKRIFLRSTHTGNHTPVGQVVAPCDAPDLLRRDLLLSKATGFNMARFIAGVAHPWQLDLCDEIGLLVYEESLAAWLLGDSPHMVARFDQSVREMILRDRNHPSVVVWGLLNETKDGPVFRHAVATLLLIRSLDRSRLVLLSSGRWDAQPGVGSVSNPGSDAWEHVWGREALDAPAVANTWHKSIGGYIEDAGDAHVYPTVPHPPEIVGFLRTLGESTKPVFLSEYGIGSTINAVRELRLYEQHRVNLDVEDAVLMRSMAETFIADWERFGMDGTYAFPEDMLRDSQRLHARQRLLGFDALRSNPKICGYNLTGMLDHGMTGEGLWTFWRELKPGIADALADGWAPLRWCLFVEPMHGYADQPFKVEAVLANEDAMPPGEYSARFRILGARGVAWERNAIVRIPQPAPEEDGRLAVPVLCEEVCLDVPSGAYEVVANIERGAAPAGGRLIFHVSKRVAPLHNPLTLCQWGLSDDVVKWLADQAVTCVALDPSREDASAVILIGDLSGTDTTDEQWDVLVRRVSRGSTAVFLAPESLKRGDDSVGRLPASLAGRLKFTRFHDWLYHKECVSKAHQVFDGLPGRGIMDWDFYGPVIPHAFFEDQGTPDEVAAAAFAVGYSCPGGYASGLLVAAYRHGQGRLILNSLRILEHVGAHPAADRLLLNLIQIAHRDER